MLGTWASDGAWSGLEVSVRDGPVGWYVQVGGNVTHEQLNLPPPPDVKGLKVAQLREELDGRGMETAGRKAELAARLLQADDLRPLVAHKRGSLPPGTSPSNVTMEMAERVLSLPLQLGDHPRRGGSMTLHLGRFGPYVSLQNAGEEEAKPTMASLPKAVSFWDVDVEQAATLIDLKLLRAEKKQAAKAEATTPKAKANKPKPRAKGTKRAAAKAKSKG